MKAGIAQNYDIKTLSIHVSATVATLGLGAVPTGMKRYVTMVRANNVSGANQTLYVCSGTGSVLPGTAASASAAQKYAVQLEAGESDEFPRSLPDPEKPLFSLAASTYLVAMTSVGNCRLFMQYYDQ